jgi:hypothetical protein
VGKLVFAILRRRPRALLLSCTAALVITLAGCTGCAPQRSASGGLPGERVGFSGGGPLLWESDSDLARDMDHILLSGARWVRLDADWKSIEPNAGRWNWSYTDRVVAAARNRGLNVLLVPTYTPPWARRGVCATSMYCPPANTAWYANFVFQAVSRYAPFGVHHYEIWNEPNLDAWWASGPNAADYVNLLRPAYLKAHQADPFVTVISGGLAPHGDLGANPYEIRSPVNFITAMYRAGARGFFDAFANHPYPPLPNDPFSGRATWNALMQTEWEHSIMEANGDGHKQIWGTEYGSPTGSTDPKAVNTNQQAQYLVEGLRWWVMHPYTGPLFVQTVRDGWPGFPGDWHSYMGLLNRDFRPKPAYGLLTALLH